jgi:hypothetical protein
VAYAVLGDVAHEHTLTLGMNTKDGWVEVRNGLKAGDMLVVEGAQPLAEGTKVRIVPPSHDGGAPPQTAEVMSVHREATPPPAGSGAP